MRELKRRQFTQEASLAFLAGVVVVISDCGGGGGNGGGGNDGYGSPTTSTPPTTVASASGDKTGSISSNHGHVAVITSAQLLAGGAVSLNIEGSAGHNHVVDLVAQAIQDMKANMKVAKESTSTQGHTHMVTFNPDGTDNPTKY
jgi:hypothetical protein